MKIYENRVAPNARRVRMFLSEKGVENVEYVEMNLQKGDNISEKFSQKNPLKKIPVLELNDGQYISESVAICRYFDAINPENSLFGDTPVEIARIEMWQRQCELYFLFPVAMCFQHTTGFFADRMNPIQEWGMDNAKLALNFLTVLEQQLADNEFVAGDRFSIADITALCTVDFARVIKLRITDEYPNLQRWHALVSARTSASA